MVAWAPFRLVALKTGDSYESKFEIKLDVVVDKRAKRQIP